MEPQVGPVMPPPVHEDELNIPGHFIIWLDQHIGQAGECILLKSNFFMAMDPTSGLFERNLIPNDIDRSILLEIPVLIQLDKVTFKFQAFDNVEKCFQVIEKNLDKRIFFITSGSKGKIIIPSLVINFPNTFVEGYWMYVFCGNMIMRDIPGLPPPANAWALKFLDRIMMKDHQDDLLIRMVLDIAIYFFTKADDLEKNKHFHKASQHYTWSKIMYERYGNMAERTMTDKFNEIDQRIGDVKQILLQRQDSEEDGFGETCDE